VERRELKNYHIGHMMGNSLQSLMSEGEKDWAGCVLLGCFGGCLVSFKWEQKENQ